MTVPEEPGRYLVHLPNGTSPHTVALVIMEDKETYVFTDYAKRWTKTLPKHEVLIAKNKGTDGSGLVFFKILTGDQPLDLDSDIDILLDLLVGVDDSPAVDEPPMLACQRCAVPVLDPSNQCFFCSDHFCVMHLDEILYGGQWIACCLSCLDENVESSSDGMSDNTTENDTLDEMTTFDGGSSEDSPSVLAIDSDHWSALSEEGDDLICHLFVGAETLPPYPSAHSVLSEDGNCILASLGGLFDADDHYAMVARASPCSFREASRTNANAHLVPHLTMNHKPPTPHHALKTLRFIHVNRIEILAKAIAGNVFL